MRLLLRSLLGCRGQGPGGELGDVEQLGPCVARGESVAKHGVTEGAGGADCLGASGCEFGGADAADALAGFFAEKSETSAGSAAKAALVRAGRLDEGAGGADDLAGLLVDVAVAAEVAGVVINYVVAVSL